MSDLTHIRPGKPQWNYDPHQIIPKPSAAPDHRTQTPSMENRVEGTVVTTARLGEIEKISSILAIGTFIVSGLWCYVLPRILFWTNRSMPQTLEMGETRKKATRDGTKKDQEIQTPDWDERRIEVDGEGMSKSQGDEKKLRDVDPDHATLREENERLTAEVNRLQKEVALLQQALQHAEPQNEPKSQADEKTVQDLDNATLREENEKLTAKVEQLQKEVALLHEQQQQALHHPEPQNESQTAEHQSGLQKKLKREEVSQLMKKSQRIAKAQQAIKLHAGLEDELKRTKEELATVRQKYHDLQDTQTVGEQQSIALRTVEDKLKKVQKELDDSQRQEQQFKNDLEKVEMKYQTEIEKWSKEAASSKDDNDDLRRQLEAERKTKGQATSRKMEQVGTSRKKEDRLKQAEKERDTLKAENETLRRKSKIVNTQQFGLSKVNQLEREKREAMKAVEGITTEYQNLGTRFRQLEMELEAARRDQTQHKRQLQQLTSDLSQSKNLLATRTEELKGAQTFLSTADQFAGADLIKDLERLNAETMQLAASMADALAETEKGSMAPPEVAVTTRKILGPRLVDLLTSSVGHEAQIVIQTAFQSAVSAYTNWIISRWTILGQEGEGTIKRLYEKVRNAEVQAIAGRWRQLTRSHLHLPNEPQYLQSKLVETMADIVVLAGYAIAPDALAPRIMERFGDRVREIVKLALSLKKKAGEGVTSSDLQLLYAHPDTPYDPATMTTAIGTDEPDNNQEVILSTTDLGMVRSEKSSERYKITVLVKAKVVLYSEFEGVGGNTRVD